MGVLSVSFSIPYLYLEPWLVAVWLSCGCVMLCLLAAKSILGKTSHSSWTNSIHESSLHMGLAYTASIVLLWPIYFAKACFMFWFEASGGVDKMRARREKEHQEMVDRFCNNKVVE